jgi:DNA-binding NtrC family response regulator
MVEEEVFREDLYWRLNVFTIEIPPLRARPEDTLLLAEHFLQRYTQAMNKSSMRLSEDALRVIRAYSWPGNVRELQNALERAVVVGTPPSIEVKDLPLRVTHSARRRGPLSLAAIERQHILTVLESTEWNISRAARMLEIDRGTLYNRLEKYGAKRPAVRESRS